MGPERNQGPGLLLLALLFSERRLFVAVESLFLRAFKILAGIKKSVPLVAEINPEPGISVTGSW